MVAVTLAAAVALVARRVGSLSAGGAVAATITGAVAVLAGWGWAVVLVTYFVGAAWLSRLGREAKIATAGDRIEKAGARDAVQVVANGGAFTAMALGHLARPDIAWQALAAGALAASAADTWATEIGLLAPQRPRSILSGAEVPAGTSGGVTVIGFIGAALGAGAVAVVAASVGWPPVAVVAALAGGIMGCVVDSILGASIQSRRWCDACKVGTEQRIHRCGSATTHVAGFRWLDNDAVNALATLGGALLGAATAFLAMHDT